MVGWAGYGEEEITELMFEIDEDMDGTITRQEFLPVASRFITKPEPITPSLPPSALGSPVALTARYERKEPLAASSGSPLRASRALHTAQSRSEEKQREREWRKAAEEAAAEFKSLLAAQLAEAKERAKKEKAEAETRQLGALALQGADSDWHQMAATGQARSGRGTAAAAAESQEQHVRDLRRFWGHRLGAR